MKVKEEKVNNEIVEEMRQAGAHFGYSKSRRHPSTGKYVYGVKNNMEIFDLPKTARTLENAKDFIRDLKEENKTVLFVGTKNEAKRVMRDTAEKLDEPFVVNRWIGGTLTNWPSIKRRVEKLKDMIEKREAGDFSKYTKKEQLLIDREIARLESNFGGIVEMDNLPDALFVIDPLFESIAVKEANHMNIPVIALANTDCDITDIEVPVLGNDSTVKSVSFFVSQITSPYKK